MANNALDAEDAVLLEISSSVLMQEGIEIPELAEYVQERGNEDTGSADELADSELFGLKSLRRRYNSLSTKTRAPLQTSLKIILCISMGCLFVGTLILVISSLNQPSASSGAVTLVASSSLIVLTLEVFQSILDVKL
jgi:hypothetical protein